MSRWDALRDELDRTTFHGQLDIDGGVQEGDVVSAKRPVRRTEGSYVEPAVSNDPSLFEDHDTP